MEKTNFGDCVNVYLAPIWGLKWEVAGDKGRFITMAGCRKDGIGAVIRETHNTMLK